MTFFSIENYSPRSDTSFDGYIKAHQDDYNDIITYTSNDIDFKSSDGEWGPSCIFGLNYTRPSAYRSYTSNITLEFSFLKGSILLTHYQLQQRADQNPTIPGEAGFFNNWTLESRNINGTWKEIEQRYDPKSISMGYIGLYKIKPIISNQFRFNFSQTHVCIQQIEFYSAIFYACTQVGNKIFPYYYIFVFILLIS